MVNISKEYILAPLPCANISDISIKLLPGMANIVHYFSENGAVLFFLMEYLVRFVCSPRKWRFFKQPMNLVDFFAIIPFMLDLVIGGLQVRSDTSWG